MACRRIFQEAGGEGPDGDSAKKDGGSDGGEGGCKRRWPNKINSQNILSITILAVFVI